MTSSKAGKAGWLARRKPTRRERIACASIINRYQTMPSRMKKAVTQRTISCEVQTHSGSAWRNPRSD